MHIVEEKEEEEIEGGRISRRRTGERFLILIVKIKTYFVSLYHFAGNGWKQIRQCLILLLINRNEWKGYDDVFGGLQHFDVWPFNDHSVN